ncbi:PREDICTED: uncharacterized protein LOC104731160 isoform X2 [Camelina sativa]|uniref:Uncharacterized protein LOC104731160 isoform X2 n=1 Tax=Camelina sativa TaxID=90675 RepID=A0ABM0UZX3_CAMSA|nr:PREDICTED: uncharacterized protein LOC104731160 isoform X2 [Camelina sativa]
MKQTIFLLCLDSFLPINSPFPLPSPSSLSLISLSLPSSPKCRVSLRRNFDIPIDPRKEEDQSLEDDVRFCSEKGVGEDLGNCVEELERLSHQVFGDLSPEALSYIQHLQSELSTMKELDVWYLQR